MSKLYSQLKIDLKKLNTGNVSFLESDFEISLADVGVKNIIENGEINVTGHYRIFKDKSDIVLTVKAETEIDLNCSRCLKVFSQKISTEFETLIDPDSEYFSLISDDEQIDIAPIIRDYLIASIPIKNICDTNCKGLCPNCFINRNFRWYIF